MEIKIRQTDSGVYKEMTIEDGNTQIRSGLFNDDETIELACQFISAAEDLLTDDEHVQALALIREDLEA